MKPGVKDIFVHAFMDGRDTSPTGGIHYLEELEAGLLSSEAKIATVIGRYYAMDRDKRWERTKLAWDAIVNGKGTVCVQDPRDAIPPLYGEGTTDEFLPPMVFDQPHSDGPRVRDGDVVFFFNFRADRARQLSEAFLREDFDGFDREFWPRVHYVTLTQYDAGYDCPHAFPPQTLQGILGEAVAAAGKKQLRIAETEKYPHVTYFFNGGVEQPFPGEDRKIIPSPKVATYDLQPEMSGATVTETVVSSLADYDLVILNYANPDMVGHTGVVEAAVKAVETVDDGVRQVVEESAGVGREGPHHRRPRQLRIHAQPGRLAEHRAHDQSRADRLRGGGRRELPRGRRNSGGCRADAVVFAGDCAAQRDDGAEPAGQENKRRKLTHGARREGGGPGRQAAATNPERMT